MWALLGLKQWTGAKLACQYQQQVWTSQEALQWPQYIIFLSRPRKYLLIGNIYLCYGQIGPDIMPFLIQHLTGRNIQSNKQRKFLKDLTLDSQANAIFSIFCLGDRIFYCLYLHRISSRCFSGNLGSLAPLGLLLSPPKVENGRATSRLIARLTKKFTKSKSLF